MSDIVHKITVATPQEKVFDAIATTEGLKGWWTTHVEGDSLEGEILKFLFPSDGPSMEVLEVSPDFIKWRCTDGPEEWKNTIITFDFEEKDGKTDVLFAQSGWEEDTEFFAHCNTKWAVFMLSLKEYCETGKGKPYPEDLNIGDKETQQATA